MHSSIRSHRRIRVIAYGAALPVTSLLALAQPAYADHPTPPDVPPEIAVPAGHKAYLEGYAIGTQQYVCLPSGSSSTWTFFGPQATLFDANNKQNITHFLSPNPFEVDSPARATWQDSKDTSTNWAKDPSVMGNVLSFSVNPNAIPWLRLLVDPQDGPTGGDNLSETTYIHRVNTDLEGKHHRFLWYHRRQVVGALHGRLLLL